MRGWKACYFLSTLILVVALIWIKIQFTWKIYITAALSIISAIYIFIFAPLADENKPLDERDRKAIRKRAHKIVIFETLTGILLLPFQDMLACAVLSSVILSGGTYIVWFIREKRKNLNILENTKDNRRKAEYESITETVILHHFGTVFSTDRICRRDCPGEGAD